MGTVGDHIDEGDGAAVPVVLVVVMGLVEEEDMVLVVEVQVATLLVVVQKVGLVMMAMVDTRRWPC